MDERKNRLNKIRIFVEKMPSLSTTVGKVLEICSRPDTAPNDLNKVISLDPVLTGQGQLELMEEVVRNFLIKHGC